MVPKPLSGRPPPAQLPRCCWEFGNQVSWGVCFDVWEVGEVPRYCLAGVGVQASQETPAGCAPSRREALACSAVVSVHTGSALLPRGAPLPRLDVSVPLSSPWTRGLRRHH